MPIMVSTMSPNMCKLFPGLYKSPEGFVPVYPPSRLAQVVGTVALVDSYLWNERSFFPPARPEGFGGIPKPLPKRVAPSLDSSAGQAKSGATKD